ncbi:hypothetical protein BF49_5608 [Bradyrhizobium sp.]|nr:hypothetical protein BF49_5608 [Bradyrhizobium sp.]
MDGRPGQPGALATWVLVTGSWGLLVLTLALTIMYARNLLKWRET